MVSAQKLIKMARKWRKLAAITRQRISLPRAPNKGHFVVYTLEHRRFVLPIMYLNNEIFRELLKLSEEEFGIPRDGPITLPCDAIFMDYVVCLVERRATKKVERALVMSIASNSGICSMSYLTHQERPCQQLPICSF